MAKPSTLLDTLRAAHPALTLRAVGRATEHGTTGDWELVTGSGGRFVRRLQSALPAHAGHDGSRGWTTDWTGWPNALDTSRIDEECLVAWVWSGAWLDPDAPVDVSPAEAPSASQGTGWQWFGIRRSDGVIAAKVAIDAAILRVVHLQWQSVVGLRTIEFADFRRACGRPLAHRIVQHLAANEATITEIARIEPSTADTQRFAMPTPPDDWRYDPQRPKLLEVRHARTGHLLVHGSISDCEGWFIFDSGAGQPIIAPELAARAKLEALGSTLVGSVYGLEHGTVYRAPALRLGPLELRNAIVTEMNLDALTPHLGEPVAGIVGYDILARARVEVDLAAPSIRIERTDLTAAGDDDSGWTAMRLHDQHPIVEGRFEGERRDWFRIDLGASGGVPFSTVVFTAPAAERHRLLDGRTTTAVEAEGMSLDVGALQWLELGGQRHEEVTAGFMRSGILGSDPVIAANVGVDILAGSRLVFDYPHARMAFAARE